MNSKKIPAARPGIKRGTANAPIAAATGQVAVSATDGAETTDPQAVQPQDFPASGTLRGSIALSASAQACKPIMSRSELDAFRLTRVAPGAYVYILRGQVEPADWVCPDCLADGAVVALRKEPAKAMLPARFVCPRCNFLVEPDDRLVRD